MKGYFLLVNLLLVAFFHSSAQQRGKEQRKDTLEGLAGLYRLGIDSTRLFRIKQDKDQLILEVVGQGQTPLAPLGGNRFSPKHISPPVTIEFIRDSLGTVYKFTWFQDRKDKVVEYIPVASGPGAENRNGYAGRYKVAGNPYNILRVEEENGLLTVQANKGSKIVFSSLSKDKFFAKKGDYTVWYEFVRDGQGNIQKLLNREAGLLDIVKTGESPEAGTQPAHVSNRENGFTRADSLQGMLTPPRTCYDVLFYGLDIRVLPETKSITGNTTIRFRAMQSFDTMQVDLYANMKIEKILFHGRELAYTRDCNAVFIQFPAVIGKGKEDAITIFYSGMPQLPDPSTLKGGIIWYHDKEDNLWIESVCQGSGASLWWPCKDHLSDKPDSMKISITVPNGLKEISNGRLLQTTALPDGFTRFDWYVSYPINNYNVVINIGNYAHFTDTYTRGQDTMALNYYCLPDSREKAAQIFKEVKPMLALYEKDFGVYPFQRDGFTLMESLYPMEHQGAVSFGPVYNPVNSDKWDPADLQRTAWHETAHEWWGNNITCRDMADLWIHEAFATYAEVLAYETFSGKEASLKYLKDQHPGNKEPVIGVYNVNHFHLGDMYSKGCLMLHTLRNVINNDSAWFGILKGIQAWGISTGPLKRITRRSSINTSAMPLFPNWTWSSKKKALPYRCNTNGMRM